MNEKVSIIIRTKNEERNIKAALDSLVKNQILSEDAEVIIVDGYSADKTVETASKYPVKIVFESTGTRGGACNAGWKNAQGELIVFTDADCFFQKDWINKIRKSFQNIKTGAVGGVDLTPQNTTSYFQKASGLLDELRIFPKHGTGNLFRLRGCNIAYRRDALSECGGFDERFDVAEETELLYRLNNIGYEIVFNPTIAVYHKRRRSLKKYVKQFFGYGHGKFQLVKKHPSLVSSPEIFVPPSLLVFLLISTLASLVNTIFLPLFYIALTIPSAYTIYVIYNICKSSGNIKLLPGAIVTLFIRNIAAATGFLAGLLGHVGGFLKVSGK